MIRKFARPMLASVFVWEGVDDLRNASEHTKETEGFLKTLRKFVPSGYKNLIPNDPELATRALGGAKIGAGTTLALGKAPRTSAAVLAAATLPNLVGKNNFWAADNKKDKEDRRNGFITNTALLGALFITTQDTEGKPSLRWRAQKAGERTNKKIQQALPTKSESQEKREELSARANELSNKAGDWFNETSQKAQAYVDDNKDDWQSTGRGLLDTAKSYVDDAKDYVDDNKEDWQDSGRDFLDNAKSFIEDSVDSAKSYVDDNKKDWLKSAESNAKTARKGAVKAANKAQKRADDAASKLDKADSKRAAKKASKQADKLQKKANKKIEAAIKKIEKRAK
ncbi:MULTISPECIES: DoxX family protein [unclassified Corynebacterium]|uniref:DoxX family protein n=1 Tax=Corynebacterium TaxID=1716 RepID=UPI00254CABBD|nr:DoxX family protein [Corynebacterium sp. MSK293]MDK8766185.1 DoxX family membrane protein [Corynebacterium sp. MSK293]